MSKATRTNIFGGAAGHDFPPVESETSTEVGTAKFSEASVSDRAYSVHEEDVLYPPAGQTNSALPIAQRPRWSDLSDGLADNIELDKDAFGGSPASQESHYSNSPTRSTRRGHRRRKRRDSGKDGKVNSPSYKVNSPSYKVNSPSYKHDSGASGYHSMWTGSPTSNSQGLNNMAVPYSTGGSFVTGTSAPAPAVLSAHGLGLPISQAGRIRVMELDAISSHPCSPLAPSQAESSPFFGDASTRSPTAGVCGDHYFMRGSGTDASARNPQAALSPQAADTSQQPGTSPHGSMSLVCSPMSWKRNGTVCSPGNQWKQGVMSTSPAASPHPSTAMPTTMIPNMPTACSSPFNACSSPFNACSSPFNMMPMTSSPSFSPASPITTGSIEVDTLRALLGPAFDLNDDVAARLRAAAPEVYED